MAQKARFYVSAIILRCIREKDGAEVVVIIESFGHDLSLFMCETYEKTRYVVWVFLSSTELVEDQLNFPTGGLVVLKLPGFIAASACVLDGAE